MTIASVGIHRIPVIIKDYGIYANGYRYAICKVGTMDIDVPILLELINIETIDN